MTGAMTKRKPAPKKAKKGRPSLYTEALVAKICRHIDRPGHRLPRLCPPLTRNRQWENA